MVRAISWERICGRRRVATTRARTAVEQAVLVTRERAHVAQEHTTVAETELPACKDSEG